MDFQENIRSKLERSNCPEHSPPDVLWHHIMTAILQTSNKTLGFTTKSQRFVWWQQSRNTDKCWLKKSSTQNSPGWSFPKKAAFRLSCWTHQCKVRNIQNDWWSNLVERTQHCADPGDYRGLYKALKTVKPYQTNSPLRNAGGKEQLTEKWLNPKPTVQALSYPLQCLPHRPSIDDWPHPSTTSEIWIGQDPNTARNA